MTVVDKSVFSTDRFFEDVKKTCNALNAPFSESKTRAIIEAYKSSFNEGAVSWRATSIENSAINFRFYERRSIDTVSVAQKAEFVKPNHPLASLVKSWNSLYEGTPQQWCDFDPAKGLAKTWVFLGDMRPIDDILSVEGVPESIRQHGFKFKSLGLKEVRHVAVDWSSETINVYFRAPGPISKTQADELVGLADCPPVDEEEVVEMSKYLYADGFAFACTMRILTGEITRVAFYALKLPSGVLPVLGDRLTSFFSKAPSYDPVEMNAVA